LKGDATNECADAVLMMRPNGAPSCRGRRRGLNGSCREIDANDGVPFVDREFLDGSDMLDAALLMSTFALPNIFSAV